MPGEENLRFIDNYFIYELYISVINISNKPCQRHSTECMFKIQKTNRKQNKKKKKIKKKEKRKKNAKKKEKNRYSIFQKLSCEVVS